MGKTAQDIFTHTVSEQIGARVYQDTAADAVVSIVIVSETAQRSFQTADEDRNVAERLADMVGINDNSAVGTESAFSSGAVVVVTAVFFGGGIVCHHGVDVAGGYKEAQTRSAELFEVIGGFPVGLTKHRHGETCVFEDTADDGRAERRMVNVRVAVYVYEIGSGRKLLGSYGKKSHSFYSVWLDYCLYYTKKTPLCQQKYLSVRKYSIDFFTIP